MNGTSSLIFRLYKCKGDIKMAKLECSVRNCFYNEDKYCSKGDIMVGGKDATTSRYTCCESFRERKGDTASNAVCHPKKEIVIGCQACNCVYNKDEKCSADCVDISGNNACDCKETECKTFNCK